MRIPAAALSALLASFSAAAQVKCDCDPARPETMQVRQCSLCAEAEKHPPEQGIFFLRDNNPRKPNRWLALPRQHAGANHPLESMPAAERAALWKAAAEKGRELFGDGWGIAYNGSKVRTQCHTHIHIGRLIRAPIETGKPLIVTSFDQIPNPNGAGIWVHPVGRKYHVHVGEQICETVLAR
jgi:hypothetical protein